jgi:hypothetical protein
MVNRVLFPYERYEKLAVPLTFYYPEAEEEFARWIYQSINKAGSLLTNLLGQPMPEIGLLLVSPADWQFVPRDEDEDEDLNNPHPFWTDATSPPSIVIPLELDPIFGEPTLEKKAFMLYHELALAFLENDPRPYPLEYPLWADEWQLKFAALWISQQVSGHQDIVYKDLHEKYVEIFEPEEDGKTPVTIRGFDWYEDTIPEDYLCYEILLEQLACDILKRHGPEVLPRFLALYRKNYRILLSDELTKMLGDSLGEGGIEWLEELVYF